MVQWYIEDQVGVWNWERWKDAEFDKLFQELFGDSPDKFRPGLPFAGQEIDKLGLRAGLGFFPAKCLHETHEVESL